MSALHRGWTPLTFGVGCGGRVVGFLGKVGWASHTGLKIRKQERRRRTLEVEIEAGLMLQQKLALNGLNLLLSPKRRLSRFSSPLTWM